jgi:hypothetical protein
MKTSILTKALAIAFLAGAAFFVTGCKDNTTEPTNMQEYDSEAAADMTASGIGTDAGGAGVSFDDSYTLMQNGDINSAYDKDGTPQLLKKSFDPGTKTWTLQIERKGNKNGFNFDATITYTYSFFDAGGIKMDSLVKGVTNRIDISMSRNRTISKADRLDVSDTAWGAWSITNILAGIPILNGDYDRNGSITFHTADNGDRGMTHTFSVNFDNDTLVRKDGSDGKYTYLQGHATSHFTATTLKGYHIERNTDITFNGDGTATLLVTRTSGDGSVDIFTIDVKQGKWLRRGR